jgi:hypothetical protein
MISPSDLLYLPYTRDLTEGGIAYALRSLPYIYNRIGGSAYDRLRRMVASAAVELAFRRYLAEQNIAFDIKSALPFTEHERHDVSLGGCRCEIKSFLISRRDQISQVKHNSQILLRAPALVASDQHAGDSHSHNDIYLFAFLFGLITATQNDLQKVLDSGQPHYLVHVMPKVWNRPSQWNPLGGLVLKSEAEEKITLEIGGQDEGREMRSFTLELPPRTRVQIEDGFFSVAYLHVKSSPGARIGIHSPVRKQTYLINPSDWSNIWVYGMDVMLVGYMTRDEFSRRASFIQAGSRVFQYDATHVKNLAIPMSDLKPLSELLERARSVRPRLDTAGDHGLLDHRDSQ